ncbi:MAG TPA: plastocyanin/azurin family copper-binding protein [Candidatus Elarobacter sp.]|nr:plastocyanin/azurin family copper-binding protein [Candidatus Elarobacter sp.]
MRYFGISTVAAGALLLAACGGGDKKAADTTAAATTTTTDTTATAAAPAAAPAAGAVAAAPITGTTHEVKMIGDEKGYRFEPASITIKEGDAIKYVNVTGGPHNVAFDPALVPADVKAQLSANMPEQQGELSGKLLVAPNDSYTVSFGKIKPGTYEAHCTPHLAMNMKQSITVQ